MVAVGGQYIEPLGHAGAPCYLGIFLILREAARWRYIIKARARPDHEVAAKAYDNFGSW